MTEGFELRGAQIELCICGRRFCVELRRETAELCNEILREAKKRLKLLKTGSKDDLVSEAGICVFLKQGIDKFLGDGATDGIFGERPQDICEVADLMCYIVSKIRDGFEKLDGKSA